MANLPISGLASGAAVSDTDLFPDVQTGGVGPVKVTASQIKTYAANNMGNIATYTNEASISELISVKLNETVSVNDFGAIGNGINDDTVAIQSAVTYAYTNNKSLFWPSSTYLTTASISNLHSVVHYGSARINRGSDYFYVRPVLNTTVNRIYISTTGSDSNDGLSSSQPMLTLQHGVDILFNYGPYLGGDWRIVLAAGTYTNGAQVNGLKSNMPISFYGPNVGGHPNVPTAIVDGTIATSPHGLLFYDGVQAYVQDIKFQNFTSTSTSYGVAVDIGGSLYTKNVHTKGNKYAGISIDENAVGRVSGGIHDANQFFGIKVHDNACCWLGYNASAGTNQPIIKNTSKGVGWLDGAQGHIDYCIFQSCDYGIRFEEGSRAQVTSCTFDNLYPSSTADVYSDPSCQIYFEGVTTFSTTPNFLNRMTSITTAQFDATSDASWTDIPGLSVDLVSGNSYALKAVISVSGSASGGASFALGGTYSGTLRVVGKMYNGTTILSSQATTSANGAVGSFTGVVTDIYIDGTIICTNTGNLTIRFSQNASNPATSSVLHPSYMTVTSLPGGGPY